MAVQIKLNHDETIISFDEDSVKFHKGFYDPDISKHFEINLSSLVGEMDIVFKEKAIARMREKGFALLRGIYHPDVMTAIKVLDDGIYLNEPWVVVGVEDGTNYFLCQQEQGIVSWESDFENECITLFSKEDAEMELKQQKEADMDWFTTLSACPVSYFEAL